MASPGAELPGFLLPKHMNSEELSSLGSDLQTDYLEELNPSEKVLRIMQRMISPAWTERQLSENLFFAGEIADRVPVLHLLCTKNASAAA